MYERYQINSSYQQQKDIDKGSIKKRNKLYRGKTIPSNAPGRLGHHVWGVPNVADKKQTDAMFTLTPGHIKTASIRVGER
jgi:hypothetical protein